MTGVDRFLAEIRTMAGLQHPRILPLFDSGLVRLPAADGGPGIDLPYQGMPYVAGQTLRARLARERQLPGGEDFHDDRGRNHYSQRRTPAL